MKTPFIIFLLSVFVSTHAQEWALMSPLKTGSDVRGVSFLNELHGMAVLGVPGDILETRDGGETWRRPWIPTISGNLYDIEFVTEDTLFTCGSNGGLWRSIDGGNSWTDQNAPTVEWLYQLHFINNLVGFATGFNGVILRTENGGNSWQVIPSGTTNRLYGIEFVNDTLGFISGWNNTILKTVDAGQSWETLTQTTTVSFQCTSFINDQIGWVCGNSGTVMKTINGGATWTTQVTGGTPALYYIHFRNAQIGFAVGSLGALYTTSNGGSTWNTSQTLGNEDMYCGDADNGSTVYVMGKHRMYKSVNSGDNWELIKSHVTLSSFKDIWFQNDLVGTAVGAVGVIGEGSNQSGIVQTTDGGKTWTIRNQGSSGGWYGVHFPTPSTGYVVGGLSLGKTTNGGTNWTYSTPFTASCQAVNFWDAQNGSVGGSAGMSGICSTTNGGTSFTCADNTLANAIQYVSADMAYAVHPGSATTFLKTIDGGDTWEIIYGMQGSNSSLHFLNETEGWVGSIGSVWHTIDGGESWTEYYAGGAGLIVGIHFYSPTLGFIVDQGNNLFKTTDGGQTWEYLLGTYVTMGGCYKGFFTENYCYIASYQGEIYRTELGCGSFSAGNIVGDSEWCENQTGTLFTPQTLGGMNYVWTLPPGWTGATNSSSIQPIASDQSGEVSVTVTNQCGLQSTVYYDVFVMPLVTTPTSIDGPSSICNEGTYEYSIQVDPAATEYLWQTGSQLTYTTNENVLTVTGATGNSLINVRTSNECGVSDYASMNIFISAPPVVTLELNVDSVCASNVVALSGGEPSGGFFSGEGVTSNTLDASQVVGEEVIITYSYSESNGCAGSATQTIDIYQSYASPSNFNDDCGVNVEDLDLFMSSFGCINNCGEMDLNGDGVVGSADLMLLMGMLTE